MRMILSAVIAILMSFVSEARAADLVVWWEKGFYAEEDEAVAEIIGAFEDKTGLRVELTQPTQDAFPGDVQAALAAGQPPDFAFGLDASEYAPEWAFEGHLADLSAVIEPFKSAFNPTTLDHVLLVNGKTGERRLHALPMGHAANHIHVWTSLLERAGFASDDIPKEWEAFWSFWCEEVQPAVRATTGRADMWAIGLSMAPAAFDTADTFFQFVAAYGADYVTREGQLVIDRPGVRQGLVQALERYTALYLQGCVPPDATTWTNIDNNQRFLDGAVVMTPNPTLSIPNALRRERPEAYYDHTRTVAWPSGPAGDTFPIVGLVFSALVFEAAANRANAMRFIDFLLAEGWLAHYLNFSAERMLPPMPALLEQPFWLDPSDPHRMAAVMQVASRPLMYDYAVASGDWRHARIRYQESVWGKAVHRVVTDGISPEQAVDEAIARIKEILAE